MELESSVQKWGKRYRIININAVNIKFHNNSVEDHLEVIWQSKDAQDAEFFVEFNNNILGNDLMSLNSLLHGMPQL